MAVQLAPDFDLGMEPSAEFVDRQLASILGTPPHRFTQDADEVVRQAEAWCDLHEKVLDITRIPHADCKWLIFVTDRLDLRGEVAFHQGREFADTVARALLNAIHKWLESAKRYSSSASEGR